MSCRRARHFGCVDRFDRIGRLRLELIGIESGCVVARIYANVGTILERLLAFGAAQALAGRLVFAVVVGGDVAPLEHAILARERVGQLNSEVEFAGRLCGQKEAVLDKLGLGSLDLLLAHLPIGDLLLRRFATAIVVARRDEQGILVEALLVDELVLLVVLTQAKLEVAIVVGCQLDRDSDRLARVVLAHDDACGVRAARLVVPNRLVGSVLESMSMEESYTNAFAHKRRRCDY